MSCKNRQSELFITKIFVEDGECSRVISRIKYIDESEIFLKLLKINFLKEP